MILLLQADAGAAGTLAAAVAAIPGVTQTAVTSGPYDVISHVNAGGDDAMRQVLDAVRRADGLTRLCVCRPSR
jgi:hypothetical protein